MLKKKKKIHELRPESDLTTNAGDCTCWRVQIDDVSCLAPGIWIALENHASILTVLAALSKFDFEWAMLINKTCTSDTGLCS